MLLLYSVVVMYAAQHAASLEMHYVECCISIRICRNLYHAYLSTFLKTVTTINFP